MFKLTERQCEVLRVLEETNGNMEDAERVLGISKLSLGSRIGKIRNKTTLDPTFSADRRQLLRLIREQNEAKAREDKTPFKKCDRPCRYRAAEFALNGCDYLSITGHSRGCPPCDECTKFEAGARRSLIMDEWKVPKVQTLEEADVYTINKVKQRLHYNTSG